jgi:hypothetical protein
MTPVRAREMTPMAGNTDWILSIRSMISTSLTEMDPTPKVRMNLRP